AAFKYPLDNIMATPVFSMLELDTPAPFAVHYDKFMHAFALADACVLQGYEIILCTVQKSAPGGATVFHAAGSDPLERRMHRLRASHLGPALDRIGALVGRKPYWGRAYGRIAEAYTELTKFGANYAFATRNLLVLRDCLTDEDKEKITYRRVSPVTGESRSDYIDRWTTLR
ncbi:hypothetical protein PRIPAC_81050, partial [Pristionchus pacificus]